MSAVGAGRDAGPGLPGRPPFGARLAAAMDERGPLCVGIDPHRELLEAWGLGDDAAGLLDTMAALRSASASAVRRPVRRARRGSAARSARLYWEGRWPGSSSRARR